MSGGGPEVCRSNDSLCTTQLTRRFLRFSRSESDGVLLYVLQALPRVPIGPRLGRLRWVTKDVFFPVAGPCDKPGSAATAQGKSPSQPCRCGSSEATFPARTSQVQGHPLTVLPRPGLFSNLTSSTTSPRGSIKGCFG